MAMADHPREREEEPKGRHLVLVHGACHGAWCWYKLSDILLHAGHRVTAIDLGGSGINPMPADDLHSLSAYTQPLTQFLSSRSSNDDKVILVGHSFGGFSLTYAMERFSDKIAAAVFVAAFMPASGTLLSTAQIVAEILQQLGSLGDAELYYANGPDNPPTSFKFGIQFSRQYLYQNSPSQDITLAGTLLRSTPCLEERISYTNERYGLIPRVYAVAEEDKLLTKEWQRKIIAENPPDRVYEIEGSDHSAFFSNPHRLAEILEEISNIY